ncbi:MAG: TOBE domain-containing protein, partial [Spirochaetales bacterium]|nr:TOBE domain-containing protein [Spirochaetales bacterium]
THDQVEAMTMADRIVIMNQGEVQQIGTPDEVYNTPSNVFVGGFIGSPAMNFITGKLEKTRFVTDTFSLSVEGMNLSGYEGQEIILGVRPEHFALDGPENQGFSFRVDIIEYLGCEYIVHVSAGDMRYRVRLAVGYLDARVGDMIKLYINLKKACFFDAQTEARIDQEIAE